METPANGTEIQPLVTTTGRRTGSPHTVRIRMYYWHGRLIATSPYPRIKRDWVPNIVAHPEVTIQSGSAVAKAQGKLLDRDPETRESVIMRRISWRTEHCPILEPTSTSVVEFFTEGPPEALFADAFITHSPDLDPLAASTLEEIVEWQNRGNWNPRQPRPDRATQG